MKFGQLKKTITRKVSGYSDDMFNFIFGKLPYRVNRFIKDNGNKRIESITVYRAPIQSLIDKLFNILSMGKFDEAKDTLGYDDLFHLYAILTFNDDTRAIIEKNQDINITDDVSSRDKAESLAIDLGGQQPTLTMLLENTKKEMGDRFYSYDAFKNNCQDFIFSMINSNGFMTPEASAFIKQNAGLLLKSLPGFADKFASTATTTGSYVNRFMQRIGLKGFEEGGLVI